MVSVRFKGTDKVYQFDAGGIDLKSGDEVVVETTLGLEMGRVVASTGETAAGSPEPLKPVLRKASASDIQRASELKGKEGEALVKSRELVRQKGLPLKPLAARYTLDSRKVTLYFSAQERIDFRQLLRDLSSALKTRVEMHQVGPRDEAKLVGGMGRCGRPLCCSSFLCKIAPVSIKMAKTQDLSLNPTKISGVCGRLLCCLAYEQEQYLALKQKMPGIGEQVTCCLGNATVTGGNPLKETALLELEGGATAELPVSELKSLDQEDGTPSTKGPPRRRRRRKKSKNGLKVPSPNASPAENGESSP